MKLVKIGNKIIGEGCPVFIIAEVGINHNGDIETAKRLIDVAVEAGCDAVKFQKRTVDVVYSKEELEKPRENPFGKTNGDLKRGLEFGQKEYEEIDAYCKEKGILWFASPWDEGSVDFLEQFNPPCHKIASASITDLGLLRHIKSKGKPIIASTGMSDHEIIRRAIEVIGKKDLVLLHTVSTYPARSEDLNLLAIKTLANIYKLPVGYSGHETGIIATVLAAALGACVLERHITLDRAMWGSDQSASVEPQGLKKIVEYVREWEKARGTGKKEILDLEVSIIKKLRRK